MKGSEKASVIQRRGYGKTLDMKSVTRGWTHTCGDLFIRALFVEGSLWLHDSYVTECYFGQTDRLLLGHKNTRTSVAPFIFCFHYVF